IRLLSLSLAPLAAFSVDVARTWVTPEGAPYVLSSLLHQDSGTNQTWLLVTSPRTSRTASPLHQCSLLWDELHCQPVEHAHIPKGRYRGVTLVRNHHGVLVCLQVPVRQPHSLSSELTGNCNLLAPDLRPRAQVYFSDLGKSPGARWPRGCWRLRRRDLQVEEEEEEEIAIILDGSGSIDPPDFQRAKDFISNMMRNIYEKCFECSFALVQYGSVIQTELDLQDSQDVAASLDRVQNITQVGSVTKTASAMQHVLDNIFTPSHGSKAKASKVMVVLTDGDIFNDPLNLTTVINSPKMQGVERFAIGVGGAFNKSNTYNELKLIASDPDEDHAFKVTNYMALDGLLSKLQQRIIRVEGMVGDAPHYQLAQVGFSAQILDEGQVLLGAVGAFDWSGGVLLYDTHSRRGRFLNQTVEDARGAQYSYLGYSVAVLHKTCGLSYVAGAPRHKQRGAVFELQKEGRETDFALVLEGEQMGSYFGSELCPVDVDMDGITDLLLVAAPFHHIQGEEGRVSVYRVNHQDGSFTLARTLSGHSRLPYARFGFAMATVGDISQDKLTDVAIGAPLEDFGADDGAGFGSVYIYNGHSTNQLVDLSTHQIRASAVAPGLHYFGMSVAGGLDFSGDGLADITVGALGRAAVLRARPVVRLKVSMTFIPEALPIGFHGGVKVHLCFEHLSSLPGLGETSLNFTLDVDAMKQRKRMQCSDERQCQSSLRKWGAGPQLCEPFLLLPTEKQLCQEDCFSSIIVKVSYQLQTPEGRTDHPQPVLDVHSEPSAYFQLPYEKACKNKLFCIAELQLDTTLSQRALVVGLTKELTMNISLTNSGEDSYMTSMALNYPRNLQFKRIQKPPSLNIQCDDPKPEASVLVMNCAIGHPILKRSSAMFSLVWQLEESAFPDRTANISVSITKGLEANPCPLKCRPSVMYLNTSQALSYHREFLFDIYGENPFGAKFQLQICVPVKLQGFQLIRVKNLTKTQADTVCTQKQEPACGSNPVERVEEWHSVSCDITSDKENVTVSAELSLSQSEQFRRDVTELAILGEISFNKSLYEGLNAENHKTKITVIFLKDEEVYSLSLIIQSSVGGLLVLIVVIAILVKCGFFKRKYQQLNLDSMRQSQLKSDSLLEEEN
uniref:VWFA domain-containing protein n=1 Tax=Sus scrofa TaxID=9823 RepID=A0A8D1KH34_PIG